LLPIGDLDDVPSSDCFLWFKIRVCKDNIGTSDFLFLIGSDILLTSESS